MIKKHMTSVGLLLLTALALAALFSAAAIRADGPNRVGLVVVHGDGDVTRRCVEFTEDDITGYDVLERSGLDLNVEAGGGVGLAICRIDGQGCDYPAEPCFCECAGGSSDCAYWSYWHLIDGDWRYSGSGADISPVGDGDVEGWVWGAGAAGDAPKPPDIQFEDICAPAAPTAASTMPPSRTPTPPPTNTPPPTHTPQPPTIAYFRADRTAITAGESVTLSWDLSHAEAAYLREGSAEQGVVAPGSQAVSPATTTVYTLIARNDGGDTTAQVTITVLPAAATPTTAPVAPSPPVEARASATPSPGPASSALALHPQPPTASVVPAPIPTDSAQPPGGTAVPPASVEPSSMPLPTAAPLPTISWGAAPLATEGTSTPAAQAALRATSPLALQKDGTPPTLLRDTNRQRGYAVPFAALAAIGVVALLVALVGIAVAVLAIRRGTR